jgi:integrase
LIHHEAAEVQALFDRLRRSTATAKKPLPSSETLSAREIEDLARTWFSRRLVELEARTPFSMDAAARADAIEQAEMDESDLRSLDPPLSHVQQQANKLFAERGLEADWRAENAHRLTDLILRAKLELVRRWIANLRGDFSQKPRDDMFQGVDRALNRGSTGYVERPVGEVCSAPFGDRSLDFMLAEWKASLVGTMRPRQVHQYVADLNQLVSALSKVGEVRKRNLQSYIEHDLAQCSPNTIIRKFSAIRKYWAYLKAHELVPEDTDPFKGLILPTKRAQVVRRQWTPQQVCDLWSEANRRGHAVLADIIRIAAFTGSRIEAICSLRDADITKDDQGCLFFRFADKTLAGRRDVPVVACLRPLIERLLNEAQSGRGYLIPVNTQNRHAERSAAIGKLFGRLKKDLGFGRELVFHSIRGTVVNLLKDANCLEAVSADIVGHEKPTMTYGLYGGVASLKTKAEWMEKALVYPDPSFMAGTRS